MSGLKSAGFDAVECPVWRSALRRRIFVAAIASVIFNFLHVHSRQVHQAALSGIADIDA
jgi:hypothetical protein